MNVVLLDFGWPLGTHISVNGSRFKSIFASSSWHHGVLLGLRSKLLGLSSQLYPQMPIDFWRLSLHWFQCFSMDCFCCDLLWSADSAASAFCRSLRFNSSTNSSMSLFSPLETSRDCGTSGLREWQVANMRIFSGPRNGFAPRLVPQPPDWEAQTA